ncbi:MAG: hypothetical protein IT319_03870 [Anaerolineae bacterium]|nr:hypothetical protein [Anaerolineae bacterium]
MYNPAQEIAVMQERRQRLLRAARMHQLFRQADGDRVHFGERVMALLGDLMISTGRKLKARSDVRYTVETQHL